MKSCLETEKHTNQSTNHRDFSSWKNMAPLNVWFCLLIYCFLIRSNLPVVACTLLFVCYFFICMLSLFCCFLISPMPRSNLPAVVCTLFFVCCLFLCLFVVFCRLCLFVTLLLFSYFPHAKIQFACCSVYFRSDALVGKHLQVIFQRLFCFKIVIALLKVSSNPFPEQTAVKGAMQRWVLGTRWWCLCVCYVVDQLVVKDVVGGEVEVRCVVLQDVVLSAVKVSKNEMGGRICNPVMMTPKTSWCNCFERWRNITPQSSSYVYIDINTKTLWSFHQTQLNVSKNPCVRDLSPVLFMQEPPFSSVWRKKGVKIF